MLSSAGASWEPCVNESKDPLVADKTSLLAGGKALAPTPLPELGLKLLNFLNPKRAPRPAFLIL
jgi:hypothetical protein